MNMIKIINAITHVNPTEDPDPSLFRVSFNIFEVHEGKTSCFGWSQLMKLSLIPEL